MRERGSERGRERERESERDMMAAAYDRAASRQNCWFRVQVMEFRV